MIARAVPETAGLAFAATAAAALVAAAAAAGCQGFETVGVVRGDAGAGLQPGDAGPPISTDADDGSVVTIDDCQSGGSSSVDTATLNVLLQGGDGDVQWLYPYDGTVFPGGLAAPLLMWSDGGLAEDLVYVHMHSSSFDYRGCIKPTSPGQIQLPQRVWEVAGASTAGAADPFSLELTVLSGGRAVGPAARQVVIAPGSLPGSVYYMTLGTKMGVGPGAIVRVQPGQTARLVLGIASCVGCHSISANGSRLVAYATGLGTVFALDGGDANSPQVLSLAPGTESAGLTPDGTLYVPSAHPSGVGPRTYGAGVMNSALYETATGAVIPNSGIPTGAMVPAFSPDGSLLVFNDFALGSGKGLALMDFSESGRTASNYRMLFSDPANYPASPSFLPDGAAVVFQLGASSELSGGGTGLQGGVSPGPQGDLFLVDTATHTSRLLAQAMGFANASSATTNATYLPFGISEAHQNYDPNVLPVTSGGYAWVFFDSMRHYGNVGVLRQIWGAAIDVAEGSYAPDPSHPPFFLPGQEIGTGNFRAVAVPGP